MSYIDKSMIGPVLKKMQAYHEEQKHLHKKFGIDFLENLGRRNVIMSHPQEQFLADELRKTYGDVISDGRPGYPDVNIVSLKRELECKLTTPSKYGSFNFQTDYATLQNKGKLDYLYILADADFEKFCVLHFLDLTADDFPEPGDTARGKSKMTKSLGMQKCRVLWGDVKTHVDQMKDRLEQALQDANTNYSIDLTAAEAHLQYLQKCVENDIDPATESPVKNAARRKAVRSMLKTAQNKPEKLFYAYNRKVQKLQNKLTELNRQQVMRYSYDMHPIE